MVGVTDAPSQSDLRRWRRHLANERAEAAVYRDLAQRYDGEEREILLAIAAAEERHEQHWLNLLGEQASEPGRADLGTRTLAFLARHFGSVFVLALVQRFEARASYDDEADATPTMAADEQIHEEVIRALAARGRDRLSGSFRAAVFGANDGLVSNLALIMGVSASGVANQTVLVTGLAGLLAGALSMGAGEYVSVSSQRELLEASAPSPNVGVALTQLDVNANELELVYRARGMSASEATAHAAAVLANRAGSAPTGSRSADGDTVHRVPGAEADRHEAVGTGLKAAVSSFLFFAVGALIPVLPYLFGLSGPTAVVVAAALVGATLLATGVIVGLLSGAPPLQRAMRQLLIGYGAAGATYLLGLLVGAEMG
jgi:VIT1/CCC1 family predicted Fe2+/Mn2+ transporter